MEVHMKRCGDSNSATVNVVVAILKNQRHKALKVEAIAEKVKEA